MEWVLPFVVLLPVVLVLLVAGSGRRAAAERQERRLAAVERKLDLIMANLGIREPEPDLPGVVLQELLAGRKIQAIKAYRAATGTGLKEAKDAVELLARQRGLE
ncbi:ribosomal protein L7/L12 [Dactylosporangium sp. NPDC000555]|uniref:ribosomal protein L7/L12 n=1 Tax=Dactylosporangium sp. NPDC000555 TaxID=3154260 RepID=UPI00331C3102